MEFNGFTWFRVMSAWAESTNSCTPQSHGLMYSIMVMTVMMSIGGFYVWRRFIRTQPGMKSN